MPDVSIRSHHSDPVKLSDTIVSSLSDTMRGSIFHRGEAGYEEARHIWNAAIDRHPGLVVRAAGAADVMKAVDFARENGLLLSIRGGGHNIAGSAVCDGGLMIDLSSMKSVRVDPSAGRAWVEPGVTLGDLDKETQAHGLAVPIGINSTTGIAGLTLGGGFGWTSRTLGMTVDNLISADIVTADGQLRRASADENSDLFWAIRGGGGNFGIVTAFEFQLHPVGPELLSGLVIYPFDGAGALLRRYRDLVKQAPDGLTCWAVLRKAPPLPFLPEDVHGKEILVLAMCFNGEIAAGEAAAKPFRTLAAPIADVVGPTPFTAWQTAFDPLLVPGARNYWKSHNFLDLSDEAIDTIVDYSGRLPTPECEIFVAHLGGATSRVAPDATAYHHRDTQFVMNVHTRWQDAAQDSACIRWARDFFEKTAPFAAGTVYVNFMPEDETDRTGGAYTGNFERLARIKARYDPDNLFRINQNIQPSPSA